MWTHSTIVSNTVTVTSFSTETVASSTDNIGTETATTTATDVTTVTSTITDGSTQSQLLVLRSDSSPANNAKKKRRAAELRIRQARDIPAFATADCPQATAFSSACNCIGITPGGTLYIHVNGTTTSTIPATTTTTVAEVHDATVTVTSTTRTLSTTTLTTTVAPTITSYLFRIAVATDDANANFRGQFWDLTTEDAAPSATRLAYTSASASAALFVADGDGLIKGFNNWTFAAGNVEASEQFYLEASPGPLVEVPCKFDLSTFGVTCNSPSGQDWVGANTANSRAVLFNTQDSSAWSGCCTGPFSLVAVPLQFS
ncbi:hypothetical protein ABW21_db0206456 [Orbilia brochopaga]|nr:hypothetical protein ABW21_db0206456 [Drechslerella brochopaga]